MTIKSVILLAVAGSVAINGCSKNTNNNDDQPALCGERFYYYYDEKVYLDVTTNRLQVGFYDSTRYAEAHNILKDYDI